MSLPLVVLLMNDKDNLVYMQVSEEPQTSKPEGEWTFISLELSWDHEVMQSSCVIYWTLTAVKKKGSGN